MKSRKPSAFTDDASYFLVKNFINNTSFFEWDQATHSSYFKKIKDATEVTIPKLNEMAFEQVIARGQHDHEDRRFGVRFIRSILWRDGEDRLCRGGATAIN